MVCLHVASEFAAASNVPELTEWCACMWRLSSLQQVTYVACECVCVLTEWCACMWHLSSLQQVTYVACECVCVLFDHFPPVARVSFSQSYYYVDEDNHYDEPNVAEVCVVLADDHQVLERPISVRVRTIYYYYYYDEARGKCINYCL